MKLIPLLFLLINIQTTLFSKHTEEEQYVPDTNPVVQEKIKQWQQGAYLLLEEYTQWMKINTEAIYNSKPLYPYKGENICMTQKEDGLAYFFYMADENETSIPESITIKLHQLKKGAKVRILSANKSPKWKNLKEGFRVEIPESVKKEVKSKYVWVIRVDGIEKIGN